MESARISLDEILLLGDPRLYMPCQPIMQEEVPRLGQTIDKMAGLILAFRAKYSRGRAIAAPQIGVLKQLIVLNIDYTVALFNPRLEFPDSELFELWDDCMSFPNLMVRLRRYRRCILTFKNENWEDVVWELEGGMSELMQHESDHLMGVLATQRAIDDQSFKFIN
ncbi:MAG: peptide deformylase [Saprospiraceae bacterium]|nr:peptide deformylase [Saprospiraceae bacterium]